MKYTNGTKMDSSAPFEVVVNNGGRRASSPNQSFGGGPFHGAIIQYLSTQGKKVFIILCAFILGTLIGSSFPYYTPESATPCNSAKVALNGVTQSSVTFTRLPQDNGSSHGETIQTSQRETKTPPSVSLTNYSASHMSTSQKSDTPEAVIDGSPIPENEAAIMTKNKTVASPVPGTRPRKTIQDQLKAALNVNVDSNAWTRTTERSDIKYLVNTPECKIPKFDPWDESVRHAIKPLDPLDCGSRPLTYVIGDVLRVNESNMAQFGISDVTQMQCCYSEITFEESKVEPIISENCTIFKKAVRLKEEFIRVQCQSTNQTNIYTDFHYTIPLKPEVESRCLKAADRESKESPAQRYSIMILGLDATSRLNFERHLPRSRDYILNTLKGVEMLGYNKVGYNTFPNLVAMLTGDTIDELKKGCWTGGDNTPLDNCPWLWKRFASLGYRTMYGEDSPTIDTFHYVKKGFVTPPTDYYLRPLLLEAESAIANKKNGNVWLCLGQRFQYKVATSWAFRFMERFRSAPYFGLMWSNSLTHDYPNQAQHADGYLEQSLHYLNQGRHLSNTFLFIISDHGARWGALRETFVGRYEEHLPALYVIPPRSFRKSKPKEFSALLTNAKRLTTTFDLHATLEAIADMAGGIAEKGHSGVNSTAERGTPLVAKRALSWFSPVPWKRTCQQSGVDPHWCACDESVAMNSSEPLVRLAATLVVERINNRTAYVRERCRPVTLKRIVNALRETNVQTREQEGENEAVYHVVVLVQPGDGLFEGTVRSNTNGTSMRAQGPISRLSLYGNQSSCVTDRELKIFCYCTRAVEDVTESEIRLASPINIDPR